MCGATSPARRIRDVSPGEIFTRRTTEGVKDLAVKKKKKPPRRENRFSREPRREIPRSSGRSLNVARTGRSSAEGSRGGNDGGIREKAGGCARDPFFAVAVRARLSAREQRRSVVSLPLSLIAVLSPFYRRTGTSLAFYRPSLPPLLLPPNHSATSCQPDESVIANGRITRSEKMMM